MGDNDHEEYDDDDEDHDDDDYGDDALLNDDKDDNALSRYWQESDSSTGFGKGDNHSWKTLIKTT